MPNPRSSNPKVKFNSRFSHGKRISPSQYIAEIMCERRAKKDDYQLPDKFWESSSEWKKYFLYQVTKAAELLRIYPINIILVAMRDERCNFITSINSKVIREVCKTIKVSVPTPPEDIKYVYDSKGNFKHKRSFLDDLDQG